MPTQSGIPLFSIPQIITHVTLPTPKVSGREGSAREEKTLFKAVSSPSQNIFLILSTA
jgi:hypothetical protein